MNNKVISSQQKDESHSHAKQHHEREVDILPPCPFLLLVRLGEILPRFSHVSIGFKQLIAYDVYLPALLKGQLAGLLHYAVHVHQTFGDVADFSIALLHYSMLDLEINSHLFVILLLI